MDYAVAKTFILDRLDRELPDMLSYHGKHHTLDVLAITEELCALEKVSEHNTILLKTAALFHDAGFMLAYTSHEALGCKIVKKHLPDFGYSQNDIDKICGMIMATKIPQSPTNHLEKILCDADLDYLGREDFYEIGNSLFDELKAHKIIDDLKKWNRIQISFLESHHYHTRTNNARRAPIKKMYLEELHEIVASY